MPPGLEHEEVHVRRGPRSGTPFVIAIHTLGDGVALGGCRMLPVEGVQDALNDALGLSCAMTYKGAAVGLHHGGAKCVIAVPNEAPLRGPLRRETLLDVGDAVEELGGRFVTGKDAGTTARDFNIMGERTSHLVGRPRSSGGSGDPSGITAFGVLVAIRASLEQVFGSDDLPGRHVAILGLGKVGSGLAHRLASAGAKLTVADIDPRKRKLARTLQARWVAPDNLLDVECDVFAPCALSGVLTAETVGRLRCRIVAGAANSQLASRDIADQLGVVGILWAPDFIANAGGLISVASELDGYTLAEVRERTVNISDALRRVFADADKNCSTTLEAAERFAEEQAASARAHPIPSRAIAGSRSGRTRRRHRSLV